MQFLVCTPIILFIFLFCATGLSALFVAPFFVKGMYLGEAEILILILVWSVFVGFGIYCCTPFQMIKFTDEGIEVRKFKTILYMLPWSKIKTVGIILGRGSYDLSVSAFTPLEIREVFRNRPKRFGVPDYSFVKDEYSMNMLIENRPNPILDIKHPLLHLSSGCSEKFANAVLKEIRSHNPNVSVRYSLF